MANLRFNLPCRLYRLPALLLVLFMTTVAGHAQSKVKVPGADWGVTDPVAMREKGLAAEAKQNWDEALTYWERVIDRSISTRSQRLEAYAHIYAFRDKVKPLNTDPALAKPWPTLIVILKNVDCALDDKNRFKGQMTEKDIADVKFRVNEFAKYTFAFTDGLLKIDPEYLIVEEPVTQLERIDGPTPSYICPQSVSMPLIMKALKDKNKRYELAIVYVKYVDDSGKTINAAYLADTGGGGPGGASFMNYPLYPGVYAGEPGEVELHESLHPVDMMFNDVVGYPDDIVCNPDNGSSDTIWKKKPGEKGIVSLYDYIIRVRYTRLMWSELSQLEPKEFFWGGPNLCDWLALGPFLAEKGGDSLEQTFIPENTFDPKEGAEQAGKTWTHVRCLHGVIDLDKQFPNQKEGAVVYLATGQRIGGSYDLTMGCSGGLKAFLNNQLVHTAKGARDFAFNQEKTRITFIPGYERNLYVFKVQKSAKGWKFQARVSNDNFSMPWGSQHFLPGAK